jgi:acyl-CoA thioester hydrolase
MISETKITVRYAETDQMGIVHHSVYPIWYEAARTDAIKKIGMTYSSLEKNGIMTPLVELNCKYIVPAEYEDVLTIKVEISKLTPARIVFNYQIFKEGIEKPINMGSTIHAWVGKDLKPINLKRQYPDIFEKVDKLVKK